MIQTFQAPAANFGAPATDRLAATGLPERAAVPQHQAAQRHQLATGETNLPFLFLWNFKHYLFSFYNICLLEAPNKL